MTSSAGHSNSVSNSHSSNSSFLSEWELPSSATKWSRQQLESIGILYEKEASFPIANITFLKSKKKECKIADELPLIAKKIIELTKGIFTFSLTFENPLEAEVQHFQKGEVLKSLLEFHDNVGDFKKQNLDLLLDELNLSVLYKWKAHAQEFLLYLDIFSRRWDNLDTRKGSFTQMLIHFLRMCLMVPEIGDATSGSAVIKCKSVSGIPDIRFVQLPDQLESRGKVVKVVTMAEAKKKKKIYKGSFTAKNFSAKNLSDSILGQHGVELLVEYKSSLFRPYAIGLICIGTEIIFTCLEMDTEHFQAIPNEEFDGDEEEIDVDNGTRKKIWSSSVSYSRPYNFLNATDRAEILESCFWLGYVQTNCYKSI